MVPLLEQDLRGVYKEEEGNILNVHLPHVHDSTLPHTALPEGWIVVVGVDNILEHFIYRVLTKHQRQNRGVAAKKGLFFAYVAGYICFDGVPFS